MEDRYKKLFGKAFLEIMQLKTRVYCKDILDAHHEFLRHQDGVKFDLWKDMSLALGTTSKKIHDFYHNTWSKQFYDTIDPFRQQIKDLVRNAGSTDSIQQVTKFVIAQLRTSQIDINLHYQTVYQYVNYQIKNSTRNTTIRNDSKSSDLCSAFKEQEGNDQVKEDEQAYQSLFPFFDFSDI
ncbi:Conserved_hypothetical protein [Hexamita inflata]|uniref:Uncharacterized protein n=1 Tax=Hexamita inflata TaxID=28002 RepID=A0AA86U3T2_9EUKA|nr:Conserved hypothetical protein [Hexamita inflata]